VLRHTLCRYVLSSVFIDRDGEVYACCHKQPVSYGNIYRGRLTDILESGAPQLQQDRARAGTLDCFAGCNLLTFNDKHLDAAQLPRAASYPRIGKLTLSLGWFCNIDCVMCPQDHAERNFLSVELLARQIDWPDVGEIICEGGEPLAAPNARPLWDHLISIGKKLNFVTNGLVITPRTAARMAEHSDYVYISFNAARAETYARVARGGSWDRLMRGLRLVQAARQAAGSALAIIGHFTIVEENLDELPDFLDFAVAAGLDIVNFGYNRIPQFGACIDLMLDADPALRRSLRDRLRAAARRTERRIRIDPSRLQYLGLLDPADPLRRQAVYPSGM
jgi:MoaA/NifB/PqqE/SkfB family radical SAM enzyme